MTSRAPRRASRAAGGRRRRRGLGVGWGRNKRAWGRRSVSHRACPLATRVAVRARRPTVARFQRQAVPGGGRRRGGRRAARRGTLAGARHWRPSFFGTHALPSPTNQRTATALRPGRSPATVPWRWNGRGKQRTAARGAGGGPQPACCLHAPERGCVRQNGATRRHSFLDLHSPNGGTHQREAASPSSLTARGLRQAGRPRCLADKGPDPRGGLPASPCSTRAHLPPPQKTLQSFDSHVSLDILHYYSLAPLERNRGGTRLGALASSVS